MLSIKKFAFRYTLFSLLCCLVFINTRTQPDRSEKYHTCPANTAFLFDFGVVAALDVGRMVWGSAAAIVQNPWVLLLLLKPSFYRDIVRSLAQNMYVDSVRIWGTYYYLDHFQNTHTLFTPDVKEALLHALNQHKPSTITLQVIEVLKKFGYKIYLLANKDHVSLLQYIKPYIKKRYKVDLDTFFDGYYCADHCYQKSDVALYTWVAEELCKNGIDQLIFFDDNKTNVEGAQKAHTCFTAFHITDLKELKECSIIQEALMWNKIQTT